MPEFSPSAPSAEAVFYRTYSRRKADGTRENFEEAMSRCVNAIAKVGKFNAEQTALVQEQALAQHCFPSGRAFWIAGTEWGSQQENFSGWYNCTSTFVNDVDAIGLIMELAMMGSGTGAMLEGDVSSYLPKVCNKIEIKQLSEPGAVKEPERRHDNTLVWEDDIDGEKELLISVGDSRQGWVDAYTAVIKAAMDPLLGPTVKMRILLDYVRPAGEKLKGFGGTSNPVKLKDMFSRVVNILNKAHGNFLTPIAVCLLIDEAASCVVAGNIRRSAGMRQFSSYDKYAADSKLGLYIQDENGNWKVDPEREALRMANHTLCFHEKPSYETVLESVKKQFNSGEGAIQYVPEAIARANRDVLPNKELRKNFIKAYEQGEGRQFLQNALEQAGISSDENDLNHRLRRYGLNPCGEIIGSDFHCNLAEIHLNTIDPADKVAQQKAFQAGALQVAALLHHEFAVERYQYSRSIDPIVGVSFTGLFDFFVHAFGEPWLKWMMEGRPAGKKGLEFIKAEAKYLASWRSTVSNTVYEYCQQHGLKVPNRTTTVQPAGTKSLLTGASSGWHPPKAQRFIRRITFGKSDPLVSALRDWGYNVIPAQSAKDDEGNLLDDVMDPRVQEVLVEIPTEVSWANIEGCDQYDLNKLPIEAQWGLYMQVQTHYTEHNTSATLEYRESEIETLAQLIHQSIDKETGYISAALLARFDANATFPRLPFEPIDKETYRRLNDVAESYRSVLPTVLNKDSVDFLEVLNQYDNADYELKGAAGCDGEKCLSEATKDADQVGQQI